MKVTAQVLPEFTTLDSFTTYSLPPGALPWAQSSNLPPVLLRLVKKAQDGVITYSGS